MPSLTDVDTALEACPSIAGTYSDGGAAVAPNGQVLGTVSLTALLHSQTAKLERAEVVVVRGPEDDIVEIGSYQGPQQIANWQQAKVTKQSYLAEGDRVVAKTYLCQDGFVRIGRAYGIGASGAPGLLAMGLKSEFLWLRKAVDGSLIVLHTNWEYVTLNFILPAGGVDKIWYRFVPAVRPGP